MNTEWHQNSIEHEHGSLAVYSAGEGRSVLLLHGGPGDDSYLLRALGEMLLSDHRVIMYDQRGSGASTLTEYNAETISLRTFFDDLTAVIATIGNDPVTLIGHSWGATLAMLYAATNPDKVGSLALIGMGPINAEMKLVYEANIAKRFTPSEQEDLAALREKRRRASLTNDLAHQLTLHKELVARFYSKLWIHREELREQFGREYTEHSRYDARVARCLLPDVARIDPLAEASKIIARTLIIYGYDDIEPIEQAELVRARIEASQVQFIERCSHVPWIDQPLRLSEILRGFLEQQTKPMS